MRFLPLLELITTRIATTRALCPICCYVSYAYNSVAEPLRWLFSISTVRSVQPSSTFELFISSNERTC